MNGQLLFAPSLVGQQCLSYCHFMGYTSSHSIFISLSKVGMLEHCLQTNWESKATAMILLYTLPPFPFEVRVSKKIYDMCSILCHDQQGCRRRQQSQSQIWLGCSKIRIHLLRIPMPIFHPKSSRRTHPMRK